MKEFKGNVTGKGKVAWFFTAANCYLWLGTPGKAYPGSYELGPCDGTSQADTDAAVMKYLAPHSAHLTRGITVCTSTVQP